MKPDSRPDPNRSRSCLHTVPPEAHLDTAARLRRVIPALAVVTCALPGWAGAVPAASAAIIPVAPDGPAAAVPQYG